MKTTAELLDLIHRGGGVPSTISLTVHYTRESWDFSGWVIHPAMLLYIDASGLTVHRTADNVHALRDGTDVLRGAGSARWVFEGRDVPALECCCKVGWRTANTPFFVAWPALWPSLLRYSGRPG